MARMDGIHDFPSRSLLDSWYQRISNAEPFLRWAGGKRAFLQQFARRIPAFEGKYIEPFLGSGAVFFQVLKTQSRLCQALLADINTQLIRCFAAVQRDPATVYERLEDLQRRYSATQNKSDFYYEMRNIYNALLPRVDAATFIFLNRTCWNGLYRVNSKGKFNVPYGAPKTEQVIPTQETLLNAAAALTQAELRATTWQNSVAQAEPGDFLFLDPPYYSDLEKEDTKYQRKQFGLRDHRELAETLATLSENRVSFILTNSGEPEMVDLYRSTGLSVQIIWIPRAINSKTDQRKAVPELVVQPAGTPIVEELPLPGLGRE